MNFLQIAIDDSSSIISFKMRRLVTLVSKIFARWKMLVISFKRFISDLVHSEWPVVSSIETWAILLLTGIVYKWASRRISIFRVRWWWAISEVSFSERHLLRVSWVSLVSITVGRVVIWSVSLRLRSFLIVRVEVLMRWLRIVSLNAFLLVGSPLVLVVSAVRVSLFVIVLLVVPSSFSSIVPSLVWGWSSELTLVLIDIRTLGLLWSLILFIRCRRLLSWPDNLLSLLSLGLLLVKVTFFVFLTKLIDRN